MNTQENANGIVTAAHMGIHLFLGGGRGEEGWGGGRGRGEGEGRGRRGGEGEKGKGGEGEGRGRGGGGGEKGRGRGGREGEGGGEKGGEGEGGGRGESSIHMIVYCICWTYQEVGKGLLPDLVKELLSSGGCEVEEVSDEEILPTAIVHEGKVRTAEQALVWELEVEGGRGGGGEMEGREGGGR